MTRTTKQSRALSIFSTPDRLQQDRGEPERQVQHFSGNAPFGSVGRQMNKIVEQMHKGYYGFHPVETWTPAVNLYETADHYLVCVDLAGVEKDKIDITVQGQRLTFRGHRPVPARPATEGEENPLADDASNAQRVRVHLLEVDHGAFSRDVELPEDVEADQISATYRHGLLWIELPRKNT